MKIKDSNTHAQKLLWYYYYFSSMETLKCQVSGSPLANLIPSKPINLLLGSYPERESFPRPHTGSSERNSSRLHTGSSERISSRLHTGSCSERDSFPQPHSTGSYSERDSFPQPHSMGSLSERDSLPQPHTSSPSPATPPSYHELHELHEQPRLLKSSSSNFVPPPSYPASVGSKSPQSGLEPLKK